MALNLLSPTEIKAISFLDSSKSNHHLLKLQGGFALKRKDYGATFGKRIHCSAQQPPPAWPGRAVVEPDRKSWDGPKPISIVGSTGSIGTQTLDIVAENPDKFRIVALAAGSNVTLLADQVKTFKPQLVAVRNESLVDELKEALADVEDKPEIIPGEQGVIEVARHPDAVTVVTGIVGCAGLKPTVAAIEAGKDIALANKETLIAGGPFVLPLAHKHKVKILPADSEHSAIFQCIQGLPEGALRRIILTASGGAFRDLPVDKLKEVKVADALKHPNWNMGKKITVDSATLFNKGLEVIEAHYLFGAGINPLAGCLPTLATIPIWVGLYRVLSNAADEGLLTEGFFWIPSLSGPTTIAARQNGIGISWLFPFVDGHPPLGWSDTLPYLILPVLLVLSQHISVQIMQSSQGNDPSLKNSQAITKFLPLMIGYFSLSVPSGLSLYWLTSNILGTAQQVWLQKLGGAKNPVSKFSDNIIKEQSQIRKSMLETSTTKTELKVEKLTSEGPRPGERFKQIKDQEARRRQKIEEEWRENGGHKNEADSVQRESGAGAESSDTEIESGNSMSGISNSSSTGHHVVDGDLSTVDSKEDQKTSVLEMESSEVSANFEDARGDQNLHEDPEKE